MVSILYSEFLNSTVVCEKSNSVRTTLRQKIWSNWNVNTTCYTLHIARHWFLHVNRVRFTKKQDTISSFLGIFQTITKTSWLITPIVNNPTYGSRKGPHICLINSKNTTALPSQLTTSYGKLPTPVSVGGVRLKHKVESIAWNICNIHNLRDRVLLEDEVFVCQIQGEHKYCICLTKRQHLGAHKNAF